MPGTVLIADAVSTNRIVLKVRLAKSHFRSEQAATGAEVLAKLGRVRPEVVLIGTNLPDIAPADLCRAIKAQSAGRNLLVVLITEPGDQAGRLSGLAAGADDVLTRPLDDLILQARLRNLMRARDAEDELRLRDDTERALGFAEDPTPAFDTSTRIAVVTGDIHHRRTWSRKLGRILPHLARAVSPTDLLDGETEDWDVIVLELDPKEAEAGLALLADLRARRPLRRSGVITVVPPGAREIAARALDLGASDLMMLPIDAEELALRLRTQVQRKRTADKLRDRLRDGMREAVTDPLTGLYNRRYAMPHLARILERAHTEGRDCAVLAADLDHFKQINDTHGHAAGDAVLVEVARRLRENLRAVDMVARTGGEEFLLVLPDSGREAAAATANRLRNVISGQPIGIGGGTGIHVTVSIGIAMASDFPDIQSPKAMIDAADVALYGAKANGRNKVAVGRPAA